MTLPAKLREHSRHTLMDASRDLLLQAADRIEQLEREAAEVAGDLAKITTVLEELRAYFEAGHEGR
jgi:uncharacterized protein (UPF0335 family)